MFVSPTVVGDAVILGSCSGSLYVLDRATGTERWLYDTRADGSAAQFHGEPLVFDQRVVIPTDKDPKGHLYSFDLASGDLQWKVPFDGGVATTPVLNDGRLVVVSVRGEVAAVDPEKGRVIWREMPAGTLRPIPFVQSPASAGKRVFVADNTDKVLALDTNGKILWKKTLPARPNTTLVATGNSLVVGTADGYMNWLSIDTGEVTNRVHLKEGTPYGTPIFAPPLLFVLAAGASGNLIALDARTGAVRWKQETPKEWTTYRPLITESTILVGSTEKDLCAFDRSSGAPRWCRSIGQVPRGLGLSNDGILYVGSLSGVVQAFRLDGSQTR